VDVLDSMLEDVADVWQASVRPLPSTACFKPKLGYPLCNAVLSRV
jgi:hypothetical protein